MSYHLFPQLTAKRLIIDKFTQEDIPLLIQHLNKKSIADTTLNIPHPYTEVEALAWIKLCERNYAEQKAYSFAVRLKKDKNLIGGIELKINKRFHHAELGYWIAESYQNHGFATEAAETILLFGFNKLHLRKIFAMHITENPASGKVMQHIGMTKEGELKDHVFKNGIYHTLIQYGIIAEK